MSRESLLKALEHLIETDRKALPVELPWAHPLDTPTIHVRDWFLRLAFDEPEIAAMHGQIFNQGNHRGTFGVDPLLRALILRALKDSPRAAMAAMYDFIDSDRNRCIDVLLLEGIAVHETFEIVDGIVLCPVSEVPSRTLQDSLRHAAAIAEPRSFQPSAILLHEHKRQPGAALFKIRDERPKFFDQMPAFSVPDSVPPIYEIADVLTIAGPTSPLVCKSFSELADGEFMKDLVGFAWGDAREETRVFHNVPLTKECVANFIPTIRRYLSLPQEVKTRLKVPLHRLNEAVRHRNKEDRALDLGIAFESLLLGGDLTTDEISKRFRHRGAWLLAANGHERAALERKFRDLYDYRSRAAHDGDVTAKGADPVRVEAALAEGLGLCGTAIRKIIERGEFPEWPRQAPGRRRAGRRKR